MKRLLFSALVLAVLVSAASAEVMMPAYTLGKGVGNIMVGAMLDQNYFNWSNTDVMNMVTATYGINDRTDVSVSGGLGFSQYTPSMKMTMSMSSVGAGIKYALLCENLSTPLSLSVNAGVRTMNMSMASMDNTQYDLGIVASKMIKKLTPYAAINFRQTLMSYKGDYSQVDYTIGTAIGPMDRMIMIEDTLQLISGPTANYTSNQFAVGACFNL